MPFNLYLMCMDVYVKPEIWEPSSVMKVSVQNWLIIHTFEAWVRCIDRVQFSQGFEQRCWQLGDEASGSPCYMTCYIPVNMLSNSMGHCIFWSFGLGCWNLGSWLPKIDLQNHCWCFSDTHLWRRWWQQGSYGQYSPSSSSTPNYIIMNENSHCNFYNVFLVIHVLWLFLVK